NLLEKEIVTVVGRAETVGRPLLYGSTQRFLKIFGLKNLEDLPKLREIDEIIKEIRNRGAEESIQLEITAFGGQSDVESSKESLEKQNSEAKEDTPSDDAIPQT
ncbi:MAG: SMC-Scp complex subunit ScpB, partial [Candidatus Kryptoniota bacterium]